jgi:CheY-like chemotaxis protein
MARRLLVIDDSQTIRKLVELSCRALAYSVEFAASGAEGLSRARANPPDLVLLDLVLPDMKGLDVCQQLLRDPRTSQATVLLMSAKAEAAVRSQVQGRVAGFLQKPFTAKDLAQKLEHASGLASRASPAPMGHSSSASGSREVPGIPFERQEHLARLLYARLKAPLALIPEWTRQLGGASPASFFARKLLTPELVEDLIKEFQSELGAKPGVEHDAGAGPPALSGTVEGFPGLELLRAVASHERTGVLELLVEGRRVWVWWRRGVLLLVTTDAVDRYLQGAEGELAGVAAEDRRRVEAEQARSGKPSFVSLAESGQIPAGQLSLLLYTHGKRSLLEALDAPKYSFGWREVASLPLYVEAQGREIALAQLHLERLRRDPSKVFEEGSDALQWVFERVPGFSRRVRQLELSPEERRVLTLIDGRHPVARVVQRSSMTPAVISAVLSRLAAVALIRRVEARTSGRRRVVLVDPDDAGVRWPLDRLLTRRREPVELVALRHDDAELVAQVVKLRPSLVIANASVLGEAAMSLARGLVNSAQGLEASLVAILEERDAEVSDQLLAAGFDAVLPKPVSFGDLDQLLNG